ncbi:MAG: D-glycerate 3-kinase [Phormidesmis priestleyi Ana]|uniref:D-glycerate 3-kinase n=1 Tax=Phormidesmis priestleyi Ana TaxID=1666911 RepID=A0A0P7YZG4_9CYAN|nr:MAG: D-glycerate 3-kinase [Phormidesmis priestleyi Ana]
MNQPFIHPTHPPFSESVAHIHRILTDTAQGHAPSAKQLQQLIDWEIANWPDTHWQYLQDDESQLEYLPTALLPYVAKVVESRAHLMRSLCLSTQGQTLPLAGNWTDWIDPLWRFWLPFAQQIDNKYKAQQANQSTNHKAHQATHKTTHKMAHKTAHKTTFIQGILGGQGTGKTTLTHVLQLILKQLQHETVALSIDDLYLTYAERQQLRQEDPRLIWRGPPGTHDVNLGLTTLAQLKTSSIEDKVSVPQFDKSLIGGQGDRTQPKICLAPTIVLFEGWLVSMRPLADEYFTDDRVQLPSPIDTPADRAFARDSNRRLQKYLPLWQFLDSLLVLQPQDHRLSLQWRQQAEHTMKANGKPGLSDPEIADFVSYFWKALHPKLFIPPLIHSSGHRPTYGSATPLVANINTDHTIERVYSAQLGAL